MLLMLLMLSLAVAVRVEFSCSSTRIITAASKIAMKSIWITVIMAVKARWSCRVMDSYLDRQCQPLKNEGLWVSSEKESIFLLYYSNDASAFINACIFLIEFMLLFPAELLHFRNTLPHS